MNDYNFEKMEFILSDKDKETIDSELNKPISTVYGSYNLICPQCYTRETHPLRYCRNCGIEYEKFDSNKYKWTKLEFIQRTHIEYIKLHFDDLISIIKMDIWSQIPPILEVAKRKPGEGPDWEAGARSVAHRKFHIQNMCMTVYKYIIDRYGAA